MYTQLATISFIGLAAAVAIRDTTDKGPLVDIKEYSAGACTGVEEASYQIAEPESCVQYKTFNKSYTSAHVLTQPTMTKGCVFSFFTSEDCNRVTLINQYDYDSALEGVCLDFNSKEAKSSLLNCPSNY